MTFWIMEQKSAQYMDFANLQQIKGPEEFGIIALNYLEDNFSWEKWRLF